MPTLGASEGADAVGTPEQQQIVVDGKVITIAGIRRLDEWPEDCTASSSSCYRANAGYTILAVAFLGFASGGLEDVMLGLGEANLEIDGEQYPAFASSWTSSNTDGVSPKEYIFSAPSTATTATLNWPGAAPVELALGAAGAQATALPLPTSRPTPAPTTTPQIEPAETLVVWADEQIVKALRGLADPLREEAGIELVLVEREFGLYPDDFMAANAAGEGPDILIGPHDWLGDLVSSGLLAEVDLGPNANEFAQAAVDAFTYDGKLYGMPYAVENVAFVYNRELVPRAPRTWGEVKEISARLVEEDGMKYGFVIQENDPYHFYGIQTAFGGYVFGQNEDGSWNPEDVGIDSEGSIEAFTWLDGMYKDGLLTPGAALDHNLVVAAVTNGHAAMAMLGPWTLPQLQDSGRSFAIAPIPAGSAGPGRPFLGVRGFMVSASSEHPQAAETFLQEYVATDATMQAFFDEGGRPTAFASVNDKIGDKDLKAFAQVGATGQPFPNIPQMSAVWSPWGTAMALIGQQASDPEAAAKAAAEQIRNAIIVP